MAEEREKKEIELIGLNCVSMRHEMLRRAIEASSTAIQKISGSSSTASSKLDEVLQASTAKLKDEVGEL